jgi:hypothetical protein
MLLELHVAFDVHRTASRELISRLSHPGPCRQRDAFGGDDPLTIRLRDYVSKGGNFC